MPGREALGVKSWRVGAPQLTPRLAPPPPPASSGASGPRLVDIITQPLNEAARPRERMGRLRTPWRPHPRRGPAPCARARQ